VVLVYIWIFCNIDFSLLFATFNIFFSLKDHFHSAFFSRTTRRHCTAKPNVWRNEARYKFHQHFTRLASKSGIGARYFASRHKTLPWQQNFQGWSHEVLFSVIIKFTLDLVTYFARVKEVVYFWVTDLHNSPPLLYYCEKQFLHCFDNWRHTIFDNLWQPLHPSSRLLVLSTFRPKNCRLKILDTTCPLRPRSHLWTDNPVNFNQIESLLSITNVINGYLLKANRPSKEKSTCRRTNVETNARTQRQQQEKCRKEENRIRIFEQLSVDHSRCHHGWCGCSSWRPSQLVQSSHLKHIVTENHLHLTSFD